MSLPWVKLRRQVTGLVAVILLGTLYSVSRLALLYRGDLVLAATFKTAKERQHLADQQILKQNDTEKFVSNVLSLMEQNLHIPRNTNFFLMRDKHRVELNCNDFDEERSVNVSCSPLMEGNAQAVDLARRYMQCRPKARISDKDISKITQRCDDYLSSREYFFIPVTEEEREFPIAFTILVHENAAQVEHLFRAIYREQNVYCVHVDAKADDSFKEAMRHLVRCFSNVIIASKLEAVIHASFSRLQAELTCMQDLMRFSAKWRYLINLTGQEFPLKTNRELVKILTIYNGANDIEAVPRASSVALFERRYQRKWKVRPESHSINMTENMMPDPPAGLYLIKGSAYGAFSRAFLEWTFENAIAREFLNWTRDVHSPDEVYWATLNHNARNPMLNPPGGYSMSAERKPWVAKFALWVPRDTCHGKIKRGVCIFGIGDLPNLISRKELFANKFYWDFEYLALDCMEEWILNKTINGLPLDVWYYKNLPFIRQSS